MSFENFGLEALNQRFINEFCAHNLRSCDLCIIWEENEDSCPRMELSFIPATTSTVQQAQNKCLVLKS